MKDLMLFRPLLLCSEELSCQGTNKALYVISNDLVYEESEASDKGIHLEDMKVSIDGTILRTIM